MRIYPVFLLFVWQVAAAQVPSINSPYTLDAGTWNLEWFGDPDNGPSNEATQYANVKKALQGMNPDLMGFAEITDAVSFSKLVGELGGYELAMSSFQGDQRMGLMVRSKSLSINSYRDVLTEFTYEFASRPPLEVVVDVKGNQSPVDRIIVLVLHMKAYSDQTSYNRRKAASEKLKTYLDSTWPYEYILVLGDYNDDLDKSIYAGSVSPYKNFLDDTAGYRFATKEATDAGEHSTAGYSDMIDHILVSNEFFPYLQTGKTKVLYLSSYISGYSSNTSDHFPVYTQFSFPVYTSVGEPEPKPGSPVLLSAWPNPFNPETTILLRNVTRPGDLVFYDGLGREVNRIPVSPDGSGSVQIHWRGQTSGGQNLPTGLYFARFSGGSALRLILMK